MSVKISPKYQVVIPQDVRSALGLRPGVQVDVIAKGKVAYLVPVQDLERIQAELGGQLDQKNLRIKRDRSV